jgi:hypothetical protein
MSAAKDHNILAPEILKRIVLSTDSIPEALVLTESIVMGVMLYAGRKDPKKAAEYLDQMTQAILERLASPATQEGG